MSENPKCRGCSKKLMISQSGGAYDPETFKKCKWNHYGGYVCSEICDFNSSLEFERSMPGHGYSQQELNCGAKESLKRNWSHEE